MVDVESKNEGWFYSDMVKKHFLNPKNVAVDDNLIEKLKPNGVGAVGSPACGDVMKFWIRVENDVIKDCLWKTFGCASAIASTSMLSEMLKENDGMKLDDALKIKAKDILDRLGSLPKNKIHCSVLGDQALKAAINDYFKRTGQEERKINL